MPKQPDPSFLLESLDISVPPTGFYDAPDPTPFGPLVQPQAQGRGPCIFAFFEKWRQGVTLHVTRDNFGCGGAGRALCRVATRSRTEFIHFLAVEEGLKASPELMGRWIDANPGYEQEHSHVMIGPLKAEAYMYLRTVTFWVNADQMSALTLGAQFHSDIDDPEPVVARFGSGCGQLAAAFGDLSAAQAQIGATDIAMREWLPPDLLALTVTRPLFESLCAFDATSYLGKPFLQRLKKARGGRLA